MGGGGRRKSRKNSKSSHLMPAPIREPAKKTSKRRQQVVRKSTANDAGGWRPDDDLKLILAVQQRNTLIHIDEIVKFSGKFDFIEIQNRWKSLLFDNEVSNASKKAMIELDPQIVAKIHSKAPFSEQEEQLLKSVKSTNGKPTLDIFENLLENSADVFLQHRTAKYLMSQWLLLKQNRLLDDQKILSIDLQTFSDFEDEMKTETAELKKQKNMTQNPRQAAKCEQVNKTELAFAAHKEIHVIRKLENKIKKWQSIVEISIAPEFSHFSATDFDNETLAVLRGRVIKYLMRSQEVSFGRCSPGGVVDIDVSLEGPAMKISRKQGLIKLEDNKFVIVNTGKRPIYLNGEPILKSNYKELHNNYLIEMASLKFVFLVNAIAMESIRAKRFNLQL